MAEREQQSRMDYTLMVNHCVVPNSSGKGYKLCTSNPTFREWHVEYHEKYGKDVQLGEPRDVFLWRVFHGNEPAMEAAIERGTVKERTGKDCTPTCE